jgi:triosephosphate isomerase
MLASAGVGCVLIGHSERRIYQQEDHLLLAKKVKRVLEAGMRPLFCCGESLADRNAGQYQETIQRQLKESLSDLTPLEVEKLLIAYEPVWAIGTGQVASVEVITETHAFIRTILLNQYGILGEKIPILYGGSCNEQNATAIFSCPNVTGGLIGGASLPTDHFIKIITALLEQKNGTSHSFC